MKLAEQRRLKREQMIEDERKKKKRLYSIVEAAMLKIERLRLPIWVNPMDHIKIDIIEQSPGVGPWLHLYCPINLAMNGRDPVNLIWGIEPKTDIHERAWEAYEGPLPESEEYQKASADFKAFFEE